MDIEKCKSRDKNKDRKVLVGIKITADLSKWLKEQYLSPTAIFNEAVKDIGYTERKSEIKQDGN
jgi:hypothetical protein